MKAREQFFNEYGINFTRKKHFEFLVLLMCAEIIVAFSSLGFIQIPPISLTTLSVIVVVTAMLFGPHDAAVVSLVFAVTSMWKASLTSSEDGDVIFSPFISGKPVESIIMAVGARVVFAVIAGYLYRWYLSKERKHHKIGISVLAILSTAIHAVLVFICMVVFFNADDVQTSESFGEVLLLNNIILYVLTVFIVLLSDYLMKNKVINNFYQVIASEKVKLTRDQKRFSRVLGLVIVIITVFLCIHIMNKIAGYFAVEQNAYGVDYVTWIYSMLAQLTIGFAAAFGVIMLLFKWMQEYFNTINLEANERAKQNAEAANVAKTNFLFNMSHDIRTPMNAITGFTNLGIKHIDDKDKVLDYLYKTKEAGNMLLSLINNVLEVSRIEAGEMVLDEKPGDILYSFSNIEHTMKDLALTKDISLSFNYGEIKDRYVYADFGHCMRVFVNVISNAIKYTPDGGKVEVFCSQIGEAKDGFATYQYVISDNGIGMSEEFQKHIFEQFAREKTATVSGVQGTGLGMSVVKSFVELMNGIVDVHSVVNEGTTITITIPFRLQEGEDYINPQTGEVVSGDSLSENEQEVLVGKRTLLVEDNELNRQIATDILEDARINVDSASDGINAVEIIKDKGPDYYDFILMDIQMPLMNGYEATKKIKEMYPNMKTPIIALSANAFTEDRESSMAAGMDEHVAKPIDIQELFRVVSKLM